MAVLYHHIVLSRRLFCFKTKNPLGASARTWKIIQNCEGKGLAVLPYKLYPISFEG